jgi:hypothetical protein
VVVGGPYNSGLLAGGRKFARGSHRLRPADLHLSREG